VPGERTSSWRTTATTVDDWDDARWVRILDRIEHRQGDVGLRFWGPPLWLEVTMDGPDSDRPSAAGDDQPWNWQSAEPCHEVMRLAAHGATDDTLLAVAARYTIENLVLNAVHEIGEWFRVDGRRPFPAHLSSEIPGTDRDRQGNGDVVTVLAFGPGGPVAPVTDGRHMPPSSVLARTRFSARPGTTVTFDGLGPVVRSDARPHEPSTVSRSAWSGATLDMVDASAQDLLLLVTRDVHTALVHHEADRICRAFHVDGRQVWRLDRASSAAHEGVRTARAIERLAVSVTYHDKENR